ncbi:hypothetical protein [Chryseobacterium sp. Marseille-Q3244]
MGTFPTIELPPPKVI